MPLTIFREKIVLHLYKSSKAFFYLFIFGNVIVGAKVGLGARLGIAEPDIVELLQKNLPCWRPYSYLV